MNDERSSKRICGTNHCPTKSTLGSAKVQRSMLRKCSTKRPLVTQIKVKSILRSSESAKKSTSLPSWKGNILSSKVNLLISRKYGLLYVYLRSPPPNSNLISPPCRAVIAVRTFQQVEVNNSFASVYRCRRWFRFEQNQTFSGSYITSLDDPGMLQDEHWNYV